MVEVAYLPYVRRFTEDGEKRAEFVTMEGLRIFKGVQRQFTTGGLLFATAIMEDLDFNEDILNYYDAFNTSNADLKILTVSALLSDADIAAINDKTRKIPIFASYKDGNTEISGVFKCLSISSWSDKVPTKLKLKQLRADIEFKATGLLYDDNTGAKYNDNTGALTQ